MDGDIEITLSGREVKGTIHLVLAQKNSQFGVIRLLWAVNYCLNEYHLD